MANQGKRSSVKSSIKSSMPKGGGQQSGGGLDLSGLTDALGGLVGGLVGGVGKTVGGLTNELTSTLGGVLGSLLGPLQQLQQQAAGGSEEAEQAYGQAVSMLRKSSQQGRTDAQELLRQLGEELEETPQEGDEGAGSQSAH